MSPVTGLSAFPITPCDADGRVDAAALCRIIAPLVAARVDSIGLLGSTGTYAYLSRAERCRAVETAAEAADGVPLLVGVGALRTDQAVQLAQDARAAGATAGLLAAMSYTPLTDDEVFCHFETVAREGGLPLVVYDNPATTHFRVSPALLGRLAKVPGIVAAKCPSPEPADAADGVGRLQAAVEEKKIPVGFSGDWNVTEALIAGGSAWYSVAGGLFPERCLAIVRAVQAGDAAGARALNADLAPLWDLFKAHSSLRVMYALADCLGLCRAVPPRPILPLSSEVRATIAATVQRMGLL